MSKTTQSEQARCAYCRQFGKRLKAARESHNFTITQCAELAFVSPRRWGRWERGEGRMYADTLLEIKKFLSVDLNELLGLNRP